MNVLQTTLALGRLSIALVALLSGPAMAFGQAGDPFGDLPSEKPKATPSTQQAMNEQENSINALQERLVELISRAKDDSAARKEIEEIEKQLATHRRVLAELGNRTLKEKQEELARAEQESEDLFGYGDAAVQVREAEARSQFFANRRLAESEAKIAELTRQLEQFERRRHRPPLKEAQIKVFKLVHTSAIGGAGTLESIFGDEQVRVGVDERSNSLVVAGDPESLDIVEAILLRLDESENSVKATQQNASPQISSTTQRSLLLRIFWVANNLSDDEAPDAEKYLPDPVVNAIERLGVRDPRLVTYTVNALALENERPAQYSATVPAVLLNSPAHLICEGQMQALGDKRAKLGVNIRVVGPVNCQLSGSVAIPLGHFMVLGTANSVVAKPALAESGLETMGRANAPEADNEDNAKRPRPHPMEPNYNTSRFAFVVQVIEAESFADEE